MKFYRLSGATFYDCINTIHRIAKTCLYNFDPLKPYFYTVKLGFTGYTIFSYFCSTTQICRGGSDEYPQSTF